MHQADGSDSIKAFEGGGVCMNSTQKIVCQHFNHSFCYIIQNMDEYWAGM